MLMLNLKNIMDGRKISIQEVYEGTGISRNTISQLYNGKSKGIQFSTLTKLVNFLGLYSVSELFVDNVNYSGLYGLLSWGRELKTNHSKEKLENVFSLSPQLIDKDNFFKNFWFEFSFMNSEDEEILRIPLCISEQSTNKFFQLEGLFDSVNDINKAYEISGTFSNLEKDVGDNKLDCIISRAFSKFVFKTQKLLPDSLEYIGFRTDLGNSRGELYTMSLLWLVSDLTDKSRINNLLNMKYN